MDESNAASVPKVLDSTSVEFTYPAWAGALAKAGLISEADVEAAQDTMLAKKSPKAGRLKIIRTNRSLIFRTSQLTSKPRTPHHHQPLHRQRIPPPSLSALVH